MAGRRSASARPSRDIRRGRRRGWSGPSTTRRTRPTTPPSRPTRIRPSVPGLAGRRRPEAGRKRNAPAAVPTTAAVRMTQATPNGTPPRSVPSCGAVLQMTTPIAVGTTMSKPPIRAQRRPTIRASAPRADASRSRSHATTAQFYGLAARVQDVAAPQEITGTAPWPGGGPTMAPCSADRSLSFDPTGRRSRRSRWQSPASPSPPAWPLSCMGSWACRTPRSSICWRSSPSAWAAAAGWPSRLPSRHSFCTTSSSPSPSTRLPSPLPRSGSICCSSWWWPSPSAGCRRCSGSVAVRPSCAARRLGPCSP